MSLLLAVEAQNAALPEAVGPEGTIVIEQWLRLGRAAENDLVLEDRDGAIRDHHCMLFQNEDGFALIDHSAGQTLLNDAETGIAAGEPVRLVTGDCLSIGNYRLTVLGSEEPPRSTPEPGTFAEAGAVLPGPDAELLGHVVSIADEAPLAVRREERPFFDLDEGEEGDLFRVSRTEPHFEERAPTNLAYLPQRRRSEKIPDDWDLLEEIGVPAGPKASQATQDGGAASAHQRPGPFLAQPAPPADPTPAAAALAAFLKAAGLDPSDVPSGREVEAMDQAGRLLATAVAGLHVLLTSDRDAKSGGPQSARGALASPLRLVGTPREALRLMMAPPLPGLLPGETALTHACAEIVEQRQALQERAEIAFDAVARRLAPETVAAAAPLRGGALQLLRRGRDPFRTFYEQLHREVQAELEADRPFGGAVAWGAEDDG